jgi:putative protease
MDEEKKLVGKVTHYYTNIGVAVIELSNTLSVGDEISFEGVSTNFKQKIVSMQIEHKDIQKAKKGDSIGMKVDERVREGDEVYKVSQ